MSDILTTEVTDAVATLTLNRPKALNALNRELQEELREAAARLTHDKDVRAVVIYGGAKAFAAGADIKEMREMSYTDMVDASRDLQSAFTAVAQIPKPVVAAVTGYALGAGLELALCCDVRIAGSSAKLGLPETLLGLIPGAGGTQRLTRLVGPGRAKDAIFSGRFLGTDEASAWGLIDAVVADDDVLTEATKRARSYAKQAPYALRSAKQAIDSGQGLALDSALEIERLHFAGLFATHDRTIGMDSFVENGPGKAQFEGH